MSKQFEPNGIPHYSLIRQAREGCQKSFETLLDCYTPLIDSMTIRFSGPNTGVQDREDLRQEAVVAFYQATKHFDLEQTEVQFGLYAKECIRNRLLSHLRKLKRHENVVLLEDEFYSIGDIDLGDDPATQLLEQENYLELTKRIQSALSPYENRIWLSYVSGRTAKEIAIQLGKDERSVQNAIYRIRKKLRVIIPYT